MGRVAASAIAVLEAAFNGPAATGNLSLLSPAVGGGRWQVAQVTTPHLPNPRPFGCGTDLFVHRLILLFVCLIAVGGEIAAGQPCSQVPSVRDHTPFLCCCAIPQAGPSRRRSSLGPVHDVNEWTAERTATPAPAEAAAADDANVNAAAPAASPAAAPARHIVLREYFMLIFRVFGGTEERCWLSLLAQH